MRACVSRWPRPVVCGRPIFTHGIQLVNTKPRSVRGMPRMAKRIRTTYRSGARIAWRTRPVVGMAAAGVRVQRSPQLMVLFPLREPPNGTVCTQWSTSVLDALVFQVAYCRHTARFRHRFRRVKVLLYYYNSTKYVQTTGYCQNANFSEFAWPTATSTTDLSRVFLNFFARQKWINH